MDRLEKEFINFVIDELNDLYYEVTEAIKEAYEEEGASTEAAELAEDEAWTYYRNECRFYLNAAEARGVSAEGMEQIEKAI